MERAGVGRTAVVAILLATGTLATPVEVEASMCDMLSYHLDEVETNLRRASQADNLDDGNTYARRASNALDDAALAAVDCDCSLAYMELDTAAGKAAVRGMPRNRRISSISCVVPFVLTTRHSMHCKPVTRQDSLA